jgi:hypothetical protein
MNFNTLSYFKMNIFINILHQKINITNNGSEDELFLNEG